MERFEGAFVFAIAYQTRSDKPALIMPKSDYELVKSPIKHDVIGAF